MKKLLCVLLLCVMLIGCGSKQEDQIRALETALEKIEIEMMMLGNMEKRVEALEFQVMLLQEETYDYDVFEILEETMILSDDEYQNYNAFVSSGYETSLLVELNPETIFKWYVHSEILGDYETQYHLTDVDEISMEAFVEEKLRRASTPLMFFDIMDLACQMTGDQAKITWKANNNEHQIILYQNEDTWKVPVVFDWHYFVLPDIVYHVLIDEFIDNNDPNNPGITMFTRHYIVYDGLNDQITPYTSITAIPLVEDVMSAKEYILKEYPEELKFLENTLISTRIHYQWLKEGYVPIEEHHENSPKNLTFEILNM